MNITQHTICTTNDSHEKWELSNIGIDTNTKIPMTYLIEKLFDMCDNQSCIVFSKRSKDHDGTKHIDIKYHYYLREKVASSKIKFKYCPIE